MKVAAAWISIVFAVAVAVATPAGESLRLEPSKTRVGIARVHLSVSELSVVDGALVGSYDIHVPLAPSLDDRGTVRFDLAAPLDRTFTPGGSLVGLGHSDLDRRTHRISCEFHDADRVRIRIDTGDRLLSFRTRWVRGY